MNDVGNQKSDQLAVDLVSAAAHDMKAPITLIKGLSEMLNDTNVSEGKRVEYISKISESSRQLGRIVETIIAVNDLAVGQLSLDIEPVSAMGVVEDVVAELSTEATQRSQKLIIKPGRRVPTVLSNRQALHDAVFSLVDNAIKYSKPNSPILIRPTRSKKAGHMRIAVRDRSVGVRKTDFDRVTEMIGKTYAPNPAHSGSSGLGLFAAKRIIESINGTISVKTISGGSNFFIELPIAHQLSLL